MGSRLVRPQPEHAHVLHGTLNQRSVPFEDLGEEVASNILVISLGWTLWRLDLMDWIWMERIRPRPRSGWTGFQLHWLTLFQLSVSFFNIFPFFRSNISSLVQYFSV